MLSPLVIRAVTNILEAEKDYRAKIIDEKTFLVKIRNAADRIRYEEDVEFGRRPNYRHEAELSVIEEEDIEDAKSEVL